MTTIELNADEIAEMRRKVIAAKCRKVFHKPPTWIEYVGGPLDGLKEPTAEHNSNDGPFRWWILRDNGLHWAVYAPTSEGGRYQFKAIEKVVR